MTEYNGGFSLNIAAETRSVDMWICWNLECAIVDSVTYGRLLVCEQRTNKQLNKLSSH